MKRLAFLVGPGILLVAVAVPAVAFWGDFPDPIAVHWGLSGAPDGALAPAVLFAGLGALMAAVWWGAARAAARATVEAGSYAAGLWFVGGLLAAVSWVVALANRGVADWHDAGRVGWPAIVAVVGGGLAAGVLGWLAAGGPGEAAPPAPAPAAKPDAGLVWSGSARGWVVAVAALVVVVAGFVQWGWPTVVLAAVGVVLLVFSEVRLTVGADGAVVGLGPLGVPFWKIPLADVTGADAEHVSPMAYGGWGYRGRPGVRAVVIRGGDGVRLRRARKPDLIVTVDDAERGAAVVNALVGAGADGGPG
ncbi:MAG: hypothetical protein KQH83_01730 [Actinobacteria bacterium]|nr:hypothetical protein [Actinomycetota bacterium]